MRRVILLLLLAGVSSNAAATFTCEKIKDKATRTSCIEDRVEKKKIEDAEKEKAAAAEKEQALEAEKNKELDDFVRKSKEALTKYYKDPASAQFTNLVVSDSGYQRTLCGSVNGKNSYGGYVGVKRFYVAWSGSSNPEIWNEFERTAKNRNSDYQPLRENALKIEAIESDLFKMKCEQSSTNTVTKIEK